MRQRFFLFLLCGFTSCGGCGLQQNMPQTVSAPSIPNIKETNEPPARATWEDLQMGKGAPAKPGQKISIFYTARLANGNLIIDTRPTKAPLTLRVGRGEVVPGLDQGLEGMRAGGVRKIYVPAALAYGKFAADIEKDDKGTVIAQAIPKNSDLVFEVWMQKIE